MAVAQLLRSLPALAGICLVSVGATAAQVAVADPPLHWPTGFQWLVTPPNPWVLLTALLAGLSAWASVVQLLAPKPATPADVRRDGRRTREGLEHVSGQIAAEGKRADERQEVVLASLAEVGDRVGSVTPLPFLSISDVSRLFGTERQHIVPSKEEYEADLVHRPAILVQVEEALLADDAALVCGHGASGKTTLAILLSYRPRFASTDFHYLDLTGTVEQSDIRERILDAMATFGGEHRVFVIDNAHLATDIAISVVTHWQEMAHRPKLLLLARLVRKHEKSWVVERALTGLSLPSFELVNGGAELEGAYRRLFHQKYGRPASKVDNERLSNWMALFQGDLIAFSAAVLYRIGDAASSLELTADDASAYVQEEYLSRTPSEADDIVTLAAVYDREIPLPVSCFGTGALSEGMRRGVVWVEARGLRGAWPQFRLVHPGIARLILRAAAVSEEDVKRKRRQALLNGPRYAAFNAIRVLGKGDVDTEARELCSAVWSVDDWPLASIPIGYWRQIFQDSIRSDAASAEEIEAKALSWLSREQLPPLTLSSQFNALAGFLRYAEQVTPGLWQALLKTLGTKEAVEQLSTRAISSPLHFLADFLRYAEKAIPEVWQAIATSLASKEAIAGLTDRGLAGGLNDLADFLRYAEHSMPDVWQGLATSLASEEATGRLTDRGPAGGLNDLAYFLRYAERALPDVWWALSESLRTEHTIERLTARAQSSPLHCLADFLRYAEQAMPDIWLALSKSLVSEEAIARLTERALTGGFDHLAYFLRYAERRMSELWSAIWTSIWEPEHQNSFVALVFGSPLDHFSDFLGYTRDVTGSTERSRRLVLLLFVEESKIKLDRWLVSAGPEKLVALVHEEPLFESRIATLDRAACEESWRLTPIGQATWFPSFAKLSLKVARPDLAEVAALVVLLYSKQKDFKNKGATLRSLSYIISHAHKIDKNIQKEFLNRCIASEWLEGQFGSYSVQLATMAGSVRSFALHPSSEIRRYFAHPALVARLERQSPSEDSLPDHVAVWLQLLASVSLLFRDLELSRARISTVRVNEALSLFPATASGEGIQFIPSGLWTGLHQWLWHQKTPCAVDPSLAQGILADFNAAKSGVNPRQDRINTEIRAWLIRGQANGWTLTPPNSSLFDLLSLD